MALSFSKKKAPGDQGKGSKKASPEKKNWYADRYYTMAVQRNFLALVTLLSIGVSFVAVFVLNAVSSSRTIEPFVIQIDEKSGVATVVDQLSVEQFIANEMITRYFVAKYVRARESYDSYDYREEYYTVTRLLSSTDVYRLFRSEIARSDGPITKLGKDARRSVKIKSIQFTNPQERIVRIRFSTEDVSIKGRVIRNTDRIATMKFNYVQMSLNMEERFVNPLGFQVEQYTVDEDNV